MIRHTADVQTVRAPIYLQQLCKHFGHKVPVTFDTNQGEIALPMGLCALSAGDASLHIETEAETQRDANRLNHVVGSHLERFAFRENPKIDWVETQKT